MISNTQLKERTKRKTNSNLVDTLELAKKHASWNELAQTLSGATRKHSSINLSEIDAQTKEGDTVVVPGKVLGSGSLSKKLRICALQFSTTAREKMKLYKTESVTIIEEIKKNPKAEGIKVLQ